MNVATMGKSMDQQRLRHSLQYMGIEYEFMAEVRGTTQKRLGKKIPESIGKAALLFNGAPDIIVTHRNEECLH